MSHHCSPILKCKKENYSAGETQTDSMKLWSHEGQPIFVERAASPTPPKTIKVTALEGIVTGIEPGSDFEYANLDRNIVIVSSPEPQTTTARTWPKRPEFREFEALLKDCAGLLREILSKSPIGGRI